MLLLSLATTAIHGERMLYCYDQIQSTNVVKCNVDDYISYFARLLAFESDAHSLATATAFARLPVPRSDVSTAT